MQHGFAARRFIHHFLAAAMAILALSAPPAHGQLEALPTSNETDRSALLAEIDRDAAALERYQGLLKKVVRYARPSVVHIEARKTESARVRYGGRKPVEEAGAGVTVELGGKYYVLTNRHVISEAPLSEIKIKLADGRKIRPTKVSTDPDTDIAVLAVSASGLVAARLGNSDTVDIGDFVLAMGSPFGLSHSATHGIVSAKGRRDLKLGADAVKYQNFIQTDAAINPGNSGGPLINLRGEVVGINTAIASNSGGNEGIGFTIPINMVRIIATQLAERGSVARAFLGVKLDASFSTERAIQLGLPRAVGAHVTGITANSPAAGAKLLTDDVILKFNDVRVEDDQHLVNIVSLTPIGQEVTVVIYRARKPITVKVKVSDRSKFAES